MKKILIIEDDVSIHEYLKELLQSHGYETSEAYSGTEGLLILEKDKFDLILLDLMLPGLDGEEIIAQIEDTPIIVLSAKISPEDKVNCLLRGANDYLVKPFDSRELLARIEVQLRNRKTKTASESLEYKDLLLTPDLRTLFAKGKKINLTKTECAILKRLMQNPHLVLTKSRLLDSLSDEMEPIDENSLKVHISHLRKKIENVTGENYIESVWGIGYKLTE